MKFRCTVCNYIYDEEKEGITFSDLLKTGYVRYTTAPKSAFEPLIVEIVGENEVTTTLAD